MSILWTCDIYTRQYYLSVRKDPVLIWATSFIYVTGEQSFKCIE